MFLHPGNWHVDCIKNKLNIYIVTSTETERILYYLLLPKMTNLKTISLKLDHQWRTSYLINFRHIVSLNHTHENNHKYKENKNGILWSQARLRFKMRLKWDLNVWSLGKCLRWECLNVFKSDWDENVLECSWMLQREHVHYIDLSFWIWVWETSGIDLDMLWNVLE